MFGCSWMEDAGPADDLMFCCWTRPFPSCCLPLFPVATRPCRGVWLLFPIPQARFLCTALSRSLSVCSSSSSSVVEPMPTRFQQVCTIRAPLHTLLVLFRAHAQACFAMAYPGALFMGAGLATAAIGNGLAFVVLVYATAGISGGHLNPAISTAFVVTGRCLQPNCGGVCARRGSEGAGAQRDAVVVALTLTVGGAATAGAHARCSR